MKSVTDSGNDPLESKEHRIVARTVEGLEQRAYELIMENGYEEIERFPALEAAWSAISSALPRLVAGPNEQLQAVCEALATFLEFTGRWDEWLALNQEAEDKALAAGDFENAGWRAYDAGFTYFKIEQGDAVLACADRAEKHWEAAFPKGSSEEMRSRNRAIILDLLGRGYSLQEDYQAAIFVSQELVEISRALPDRNNLASSLGALAGAEALAKEFGAAERHYREALTLSRDLGDDGVEAYLRDGIAALALHREDWLETEERARDALALVEKTGRQELIAVNLTRLAKALAMQGKVAEAIPYAERAVKIYTQFGLPRLAWAREVLAECEKQI